MSTKGSNKDPQNNVFAEGLTAAAEKVHLDNKRKGFWDKEREIGTLLMLVTSELAEALEADRKGKYAGKIASEDKEYSEFPQWFEKNVKDTFEDEMADTVIRILDICGAMDIDLEWHINQKLKYNRTREHKHSKAY
ncbi:MAG: NTP pyrophosphatase (non-canonical NTP hydrolase) [Ancylomarina sp.]|jgi:NTP pyrophosphatase (non-canonical NTP hydrolase)